MKTLMSYTELKEILQSRLYLSDATETTIVLMIGERFYNSSKNKRLNTAWSLAGAKHFMPDDFDKIYKAVEFIHQKGKQVIIKSVELQ